MSLISEEYFQPANFINLIIAFATVTALFISIYALYVTKEYNRKQILILKYEEAFELISILNVDYEILYGIFQQRELYESQKNHLINGNIQLIIFNQELEKVRNVIDFDDHFNKCIRLRVLADAYFGNQLKIETIAFCNLIENLITYIPNLDYILEETLFQNGFPTADSVESFMMKICSKIVKKIDLGGSLTYEEDYENYLENDFKRELGIN